MQIANPANETGLRERKRRETLERISEAGIRLFLAKGYEATTLDEIAVEAGISRRTFFYYFKSKDDIIVAQLAGYAEALKASIKKSATSVLPIDAVRDSMVKLSDHFESPQTVAIARLMSENEALKARRHTNNQLEKAVFEALCEVWPSRVRRERLRIVAVVSVAVMRRATDPWLEQAGKRPLSKFIRDAFADLRTETTAIG